LRKNCILKDDANGNDVLNTFITDRCRHLYVEANKEKCHYHPGTYIEPQPIGSRPGLQGTFVGWSCCRIKEYLNVLGKQTEWINEEAQKPDCIGCKVEGKKNKISFLKNQKLILRIWSINGL
jgi:hypothetical protein